MCKVAAVGIVLNCQSRRWQIKSPLCQTDKKAFSKLMTEFQVMHHFKTVEMLISHIYWTCDFKVVCSHYSACNYFIKARVVLS